MKHAHYFKPKTQDTSVRLMTHGRIEPMEHDGISPGVHRLAGASTVIIVLILLWIFI